jgi:hypothetical protein
MMALPLREAVGVLVGPGERLDLPVPVPALNRGIQRRFH